MSNKFNLLERSDERMEPTLDKTKQIEEDFQRAWKYTKIKYFTIFFPIIGVELFIILFLFIIFWLKPLNFNNNNITKVTIPEIQNHSFGSLKIPQKWNIISEDNWIYIYENDEKVASQFHYEYKEYENKRIVYSNIIKNPLFDDNDCEKYFENIFISSNINISRYDHTYKIIFFDDNDTYRNYYFSIIFYNIKDEKLMINIAKSYKN